MIVTLINDVCFFKDGCSFWNETLLFFLSQKCEPAVFFFGSVEQNKFTARDCRYSGSTSSILCHFPLGVIFPIGSVSIRHFL